MISEALNESDRLSSCNKRARKVMEPQAGPFHVYAFQAEELDENGNPEDVILSFNLGGIRMNETAFRKLETEITLEPLKVKLPASLASSDKGRVPPLQRHRSGRPRHFPQDCGAPEPHSAHQLRRLFGEGMDRALVLRDLHRPCDLRGPGETKGRGQELAAKAERSAFLQTDPQECKH